MSIDSPQRTDPSEFEKRTHPNRAAQMVYLAEPPEGGALAETWGESATYQLNVAGYHVYRPVAAWRYAEPDSTTRTHSVNRHALGQADALVAILPSATAGSIEVPMEIEAALGLGIPVVIVSQSTLIADRPGVTVVRHAAEAAEAVTVALALAPPVDRQRSGPVGRAGEIEMWHHGWRSAAPHPGQRIRVHSTEDITVPSGGTVLVPTDRLLDRMNGDGYGVLVARNLGMAARGLWVLTGTVENSGPLVVRVHNLSRTSATIAAGERIADLLLYNQ